MADKNESQAASDQKPKEETAAATAAAAGSYCSDSEYGYIKSDVVPKFWREKYEKEAHKYWDQFYKAHKDNFWKDRHWLSREFLELSKRPPTTKAVATADPGLAEIPAIRSLEVGCGVGNSIFPLLQEHPNLFFYAVDFSPTAINLLKKHELYQPGRCLADVCDIVKEDVGLKLNIPDGSLNSVVVVFVMSAISPGHFVSVMKKLVRLLKPGGMILFRDYGLGDLAQERLASKTQKIEENFYVRQDGTRAYYFSTEFLAELMTKVGLVTVENDYVKRQIENRKLKTVMDRIWIQGRFQKKEAL